MRTAYFPLTLVIQNTKSEIEKLCYQNGTLTCAKPMSHREDSSSILKEGVKRGVLFLRRKSRQGSGDSIKVNEARQPLSSFLWGWGFKWKRSPGLRNSFPMPCLGPHSQSVIASLAERYVKQRTGVKSPAKQKDLPSVSQDSNSVQEVTGCQNSSRKPSEKSVG